jgi:hypothetical protein
MPVALIVVAFVLVAVGGAAISYYLKKRRREALALFARRYGLGYSPEDVQGCLALPFHLFTLGDGRGTENLVWGAWQGIPIREFDYWYYEESTDSEGHRTRSYQHFSCAVTEVEAALGPLRIERENLFTRLADHLAMHDIEFESQAFNEAFNVKGQDRRFANDLLDARMIQWLLTVDGAFEFEVGARWILCYSKRRAPLELVPLLGTVKDFRDHVPRVVYDLYGLPPSG